MNDLQTILDQAKAAHEAAVKEQAAQAVACEQQRNAQLEAERAEVRDWLCTVLPEPLVDCIDLSEYSLYQAKQYGNRRGIWLTIALDSAFPVGFRVYREGSDFTLASQYHGDRDLFFVVPESASVKRDEDRLYIEYFYASQWNHATWQTAVGQALALWQEHGERLTAKLERERFVGPEPEEIAPSEPKTTEERIADALEEIASSLNSIVRFGTRQEV